MMKVNAMGFSLTYEGYQVFVRIVVDEKILFIYSRRKILFNGASLWNL